jgi:hypothetical protein
VKRPSCTTVGPGLGTEVHGPLGGRGCCRWWRVAIDRGVPWVEVESDIRLRFGVAIRMETSWPTGFEPWSLPFEQMRQANVRQMYRAMKEEAKSARP